MKKKGRESGRQRNDAWSIVRDKLRERGLDLENLCCDDASGSNVKVVCIAAGLDASVQEMEKFPRGQTVMVRTDKETSRTLDAWVETGHFKSRSEAASLFLREGLKLRASELGQLTEALDEVKKAKERLHERAGALFGKKKQTA